MGESTAMNDTTMTKADLVEEVIRTTELPRKESEAIVETIFDSIIQACRPATKSRFAALAVSERASAAAAPAAIPRRAPRSRFRPNASHSSSPVKTSRTS